MKLWLWSWLRWILPCQWSLGRNWDGLWWRNPIRSFKKFDKFLKDKSKTCCTITFWKKRLRFFGKGRERSELLLRRSLKSSTVAGWCASWWSPVWRRTSWWLATMAWTNRTLAQDECSSWWKPQDPCFGLGVSCPQQRHTRPIFLRMNWIYGLPRVKVWCHESKGCQQKTKLMKPTSCKKKQKL